MDMAVDQPGHQGAPAAVDDAGLRQLDRFGRYFPYALALDDHFMAAAQFAGLGIEQLEIPEMVDVHGVAFRSLAPSTGPRRFVGVNGPRARFNGAFARALHCEGRYYKEGY